MEDPEITIGYVTAGIRTFSERDLRSGHYGYKRGLEEFENHLFFARERLETYQEDFAADPPDCYEEIVGKLQDHLDRMQAERDRFARGLADLETEIAVRGIDLLRVQR